MATRLATCVWCAVGYLVGMPGFLIAEEMGSDLRGLASFLSTQGFGDAEAKVNTENR